MYYDTLYYLHGISTLCILKQLTINSRIFCDDYLILRIHVATEQQCRPLYKWCNNNIMFKKKMICKNSNCVYVLRTRVSQCKQQLTKMHFLKWPLRTDYANQTMQQLLRSRITYNFHTLLQKNWFVNNRTRICSNLLYMHPRAYKVDHGKIQPFCGKRIELNLEKAINVTLEQQSQALKIYLPTSC